MNLKFHIFLSLFIISSSLFAQYSGGFGRGDIMAELTASPLPVELSSFTAHKFNNTVLLSWRTETEVNNYGFEVERSTISTGRQGWEKIDFVSGSGNSNSPKEYSFTDNLNFNPINSNILRYRLKQIDNDGKFEYSDVIEVKLDLPDKFELTQNYPNPFNPITKIGYTIPEFIGSETKQSVVKLIVYDILGNEVATLVNDYQPAGYYEVDFDVTNKSLGAITSGVYFYQLSYENYTSTKKMTYLK